MWIYYIYQFSDLNRKENIENTLSLDKDGYVYIKEKKGDINKVGII